MLRLAWPTLVLGLTLAAAPVAGQVGAPRVELRESRPNPVTTSTTISFVLRAEVCAKGHVPTVSLQIYNVLVQVVAVPVLAGDIGEARQPIANVKLPCGEYEAVWDGRLKDGRLAQTGVYYCQLIVDGQRYTQKLIVRRGSSGAT
jgi:hypothetical protein